MIRRCLSACESVCGPTPPKTLRLCGDVSSNLIVDISFRPDTVIVCFELSDYSFFLSKQYIHRLVAPVMGRMHDIVQHVAVVVMTGFGLGGACAITAACLLNHHCVNLVTFGAPKCLERSQVELLREKLISCLQFIGYYDPKTYLFFGYQHVTTNNILNCGPWLESYFSVLNVDNK